MPNPRPILIYDGECPMCRRARGWIASRVDAAALDYLPCQDAARAERAPQVSYEACMEAMQLVMPDGTVYSAEQAFPPILGLVPGWGWLGSVMRWPGVRHVAPPLYRWVARNRLALSGLFAHKDDGRACDIQGDCD